MVQKHSLLKSAGAILLSFMMAVVFMPVFAFADEGGTSDSITVYMTLSDQGQIVSTKGGEAMAWKEVTVKDTDSDGVTYDEALAAAHDAYYEGGANAGYYYDDRELEWRVTKLWGKESPGFMFFIKGVSQSENIGEIKVSDGDHLTAAIIKDPVYYTEWISTFDEYEKTVSAKKEITLNLKGHLGAAGGEAAADTNLEGIQIGTWSGGTFQAIENAKTDEDGNVTLSFDTPGTYVVTDAGTTTQTLNNANILVSITKFPGLDEITDRDGNHIYGHVTNWDTYETAIGYTEEYHGMGPYPLSEIKWIDTNRYDKDTFSGGYLLYKGNVTADCQLIPAACIVTVTESGSDPDPEPADPAEVTITVSDKGMLASDKAGKAMIERAVTVTDLNKDGVLSYDEALAAAHNSCFEGGAAAGYAISEGNVTKLWGEEISAAYFFNNGNALSTGTVEAEVKADDDLYAAVPADTAYYSDLWAEFSGEKDRSAEQAAATEFTLVGHPADAAAGDGSVNQPLEGIQIGFWKDGKFEAIEGAVTDANGEVEIRFPETGDYILTASGTVKGTAAGPGGQTIEIDRPILAPYCKLKVTSISSDSLNELIADLEQAQSDLAKAQADLQKAQTDLEQVNAELEQAKKDLEQAKAKAETDAAAIAAAEKKVEGLEKAVADAAVDKAQAVAAVQTELDKAKAELEQAKKDLEQAKASAAAAAEAAVADKIKALEAAVAAAEADKERAVKEAVEQAQQASAGEIELLLAKIALMGQTVTCTKAKAKKGRKVKVVWESLGEGYTYEVNMSRKINKGFEAAAITDDTKAVVKKLKKGKTYYFKVRAYKTINGEAVYTGFSETFKAKVKK